MESSMVDVGREVSSVVRRKFTAMWRLWAKR